jgi:hypothetical protein
MADESLDQFLTQCGFRWSVIPLERHASLNNEWEALYGNFRNCLRHKQGVKAQFEYSQESTETFMIVPFLSNVRGPDFISKRGPRTAAFECHGNGVLPDLSAFAGTEFFIIPDDWSWTMIHTHEDHAFGGPYFIRKDWLQPAGLPS